MLVTNIHWLPLYGHKTRKTFCHLVLGHHVRKLENKSHFIAKRAVLLKMSLNQYQNQCPSHKLIDIYVFMFLLSDI